jgi:hypothetical protein
MKGGDLGGFRLLLKHFHRLPTPNFSVVVLGSVLSQRGMKMCSFLYSTVIIEKLKFLDLSESSLPSVLQDSR